MMNPILKQQLRDSIADFRLPRYNEIPNVGLYLEQVTKYINGVLAPLHGAEITTSMISNYVKKGFIPPPTKKQYSADQIVYLIFISVTKSVLSLDNIVAAIDMQRSTYTLPVAYEYFCCEFENILSYVFGLKDELEMDIGETHSDEKDFLRNIIVSVSFSIYLNSYFDRAKLLPSLSADSDRL